MKKVSRLFNLARRFKFRHLKLGPVQLYRLSTYHLGEIFGFQFSPSPLSSPSCDTDDWLINKSSITILMTVFNQSETELWKSLKSARAQSGADVQIIIFDDGSTSTETLKFLKNIDLSSNERFVRSSNIGVVAARNRLIDMVNTDFLLFLDPDDELDSLYVSKSFEILELDRSIEIVFPNVLIHDVMLNTHKVWSTGPFDAETLIKTNTLPMSSIISTRLIKRLGGYSSDFETGPEDWDLWLRASLSGAKARHIGILGYTYTKSQNSRSSQTADHSDVISLRKVGHKVRFPFSLRNQIEIFLVIPWLPRIGGVEKYVKCLLEDLQEFGFKVAIVITEPDPYGYEDDSVNLRNLDNIVLKRHDFPSNEVFLRSLNFLATETAISVNFGSEWAFVNFHEFNSIFSQNVCFIFNTETSLNRALKFQENFDEFWVAYDGILDHIPESMVPICKTIYTGVVNQQLRSTAKKDGSVYTVGFLGRFSPEKNPEGFLEIARLAEKTNEFRFAIAGEGPLQANVIKKARKLGNVEMLGFVTDNEKFFSSIDCLVISSTVEGIPLSAMEALSYGVPIITTSVGGIPELLTSDDQGYLWSGIPDEALPLMRELKIKKTDRRNSRLLDSKFWRKNTSLKVINRIRELQK